VKEHTNPQIRYLQILLFVVGFLFFPSHADARSLNVRITVTSVSPARVLVEAEGPLVDTWSFLNVYAGISNLGYRVNGFKVSAAGQMVPARTLAPGEFRSVAAASAFSYEVQLEERARWSELSHISWINKERGFLMLADLLPRFGKESLAISTALIEFKLPSGWRVASAVMPDKDQRYTVEDIDGAVFYIGRGLKEKAMRVDAMDLALVASEDWAFAHEDVLKVAVRIVKEHAKLTRRSLRGRSVVMLAPFDTEVGPEQWTAETRGDTVVLILGRNGGSRALLARLGVVLTHELFHLWVPNQLSLEGNYDWFFEGFTLYQALLTCLRLDLIRFEDYLDTMSRVYDSYKSQPDHDKLNLIDASERRWTATPSFVSNKGMLVAFLYDLRLRHLSGNTRSVADVYPELFRAGGARPGNANEVIMSILNRPSGMEHFFERYVRGSGDIQLADTLADYGLRVQTRDFRSRILINEDLTTEQGKLLRSLGY
jgi:predicted metalloprotease with PDZ domain